MSWKEAVIWWLTLSTIIVLCIYVVCTFAH